MITVFNKIDALSDPTEARRLVAEFPNSVAISASKGTGISDLQTAIVRQVKDLLGSVELLLPYDRQSILQECYDYGRVQKVEYREDGIYVEAELVIELRERLKSFLLL